MPLEVFPALGFVLEVTDKFWHSSKFTNRESMNNGRRCWISMSSYGGVLKEKEREVNTLPSQQGLQGMGEDDTVSLVSGRINLSTAPRHLQRPEEQKS